MLRAAASKLPRNCVGLSTIRRRSLERTDIDRPTQKYLSSRAVTRKSRKAKEVSNDSPVEGDALSQAADAEMKRVVRALQRMKESNAYFQISHEDKRMTIDLGKDVGEYHIVFDSYLGYIQLLSPRSGGFYYRYDREQRKWVGRDDGHDFEGMLTRDLIQQAKGYPDF